MRFVPLNRTSAAALAAWLAGQLAAIAICASRFPFWARAPADSERLALAATLGVQVSVAAMLFPHLLTRLETLVVALASGGALATVACVLSDATVPGILLGEAYTAGWLITLHVASYSVPGPTCRLMAASIATLLALGGPVLVYLQIDFASEAGVSMAQRASQFGPVMGALSQLRGTFDGASWGELGLIFLAAVAPVAIRAIRR